MKGTAAVLAERFWRQGWSLIAGTLLIGSSTIAATPAGAQTVWRYCLAPSNTEHKVYLSDPFVAGVTLKALETAFKQMLVQSGAAYDDIQCPLGASEAEIGAMRQDAIRFNREFFKRAAVETHWTPEARRAGTARGSAQ